MKYVIMLNTVALTLLSFHSVLRGQATTAYSPSFGGVELVAEGLRESVHAIPLHRAPVVIAELGEVAATSINDTNGNFLSRRLTFVDSIGAAGQYNPDPDTGELAYFAEFATGDAAGQRLPIVGSGTNWIAVSEDPVGSFVAYFGPETTPRDLIYIRPYWTLGTVFTASPFSVADASNVAASRNDDAVILPQSESPGVGRVFQKFSEGLDEYWGEIGSDGMLRLSDANATLLPLDAAAIQPGAVLKVRRATEAAPLSYVITGNASSLQAWSLPTADSGTVREIPFALQISNPVSLAESGLSQLFTPADSAHKRLDELIVWDAEAGFYARPAKRFYLLAVADGAPVWRELSDELTDAGEFLLQPGQGYLIRRRGSL